MKPIFKDKANQEKFNKDGFLVLSVLNESEVKDLYLFYETLNEMNMNGYNNINERSLEIREKIWNVLLPKLDQHLENYKSFMANYIVKESDYSNNEAHYNKKLQTLKFKGVVRPHQDWTFVDKQEEGYYTVTCWTALVDSNINNGGMGVIKGSNKFIENIIPSPSPQTPMPLEGHMSTIFPYLKTLDIKAGDALFFDNRTFHASTSNSTDKLRIAATVGITQIDAELVHYYLKPDGNKSTLLKYMVNQDFFMEYDNNRLSKMY